MNFGAVWPEIILAGAGLLLLLLDPFVPRGRQRVLGLLAVLGILGSAAAALAAPRAGGVALAGMVILDPLSLFFRLLFLAAALLVVLFSLDFLQERGQDVGEFMALLLWATTGAMILSISWDLVSLYVGLELLSICSYVLAAFLRDDRRSHEAGLKYLLNGALASAVLLFGLSLLYGLTGTTAIPALGAALQAALAQPTAEIVWLALGLVLAALAFKIAAAPFHLWAPDTYEGAPTPVTGYLMVVAEAAGFAALFRLVTMGLLPLHVQWGLWIGALAILTMTVGNVTALWQKNIKRLLAYSSVAQVGYILAGVAVATTVGVWSTLFYLIAYLFTTLGCFAVILAISRDGHGDQVADYAGLGRHRPWLGAAFTVFLASYVGIPATAGFMGKLGLIGAAVHGGMAWLAVGIAINSAISIGYYWNVARTMWIDKAPEDAPEVRPSVGRGISLVLSTAGVLFLGLLPQVFFQLSQWASGGVIR